MSGEPSFMLAYLDEMEEHSIEVVVNVVCRLSRTVEGRVELQKLSKDFVTDLEQLLPPGRLVTVKVIG